jgi:hypothetical protein
MPIVGGLDIHRKQITFDYLDTVTGEVRRGQIAPADRVHLRAWLARFAGRDDVAFALEGCAGWRYVAEELAAAGITAHLAEPAGTAFARGRKRHAKTNKTDARHLRMLLAEGRLPECWIPPAHVLECRALLELYNDLRRERTAWAQRVHAVLFHQGGPGPGRGRAAHQEGRGRAAGRSSRSSVPGRAAAGRHRLGGDRCAGGPAARGAASAAGRGPAPGRGEGAGRRCRRNPFQPGRAGRVLSGYASWRAAPITLICTPRGLCRHVPAGVHNGGYTRGCRARALRSCVPSCRCLRARRCGSGARTFAA